MGENKNVNLIAIKSLIECIDNRDIAEGGIFLDDDNAEFVADILRYHYELLTSKNKMEAVAQLFGKKLFDKFHVKLGYDTFCARFSPYGFEIFGEHCMWVTDGQILNKLLTGQAVIVDE